VEPRRSLGWPITLGVVLISSIITLGVGWVLVSISAALGSQNAAFYWALLAVGVSLLILVLVGVIIYFALAVKAIALSQRQSNFIDSVTHELKSPLASLKLYLQTLTRRPVPPVEQSDFHRFMLQDVERLDTLIDHLLDAAKTMHRPALSIAEATRIVPVLKEAAVRVADRHNVQHDCIVINVEKELEDVFVQGREADIEIVFRNLIDNAVKYSLPEPHVDATVEVTKKSRVLVRVADNGPGIPIADRGQVFRRFVRLGSELERATPGTGLGLYLVKSIVKQLRGRVFVKGRLTKRGTIIEVDLQKANPAEDMPR
jgi:signal transduction histidine kinase